jgi:hypothetical protein
LILASHFKRKKKNKGERKRRENINWEGGGQKISSCEGCLSGQVTFEVGSIFMKPKGDVWGCGPCY